MCSLSPVSRQRYIQRRQEREVLHAFGRGGGGQGVEGKGRRVTAWHGEDWLLEEASLRRGICKDFECWGNLSGCDSEDNEESGGV